ncbi:OmpA family protein [Winogradskyella endarachnes]|uniref:OmpA family protein n=1 Tax=Winogradskyella endarachnes TaxID=2681965 RepID=A0A6L6U808_9FLAO|nr:OmpA family protein [Winogradskyella endarachnes]MUU78403.1 OmpA family protein [Winogradskyella endarachnes]
MKKIFSVLSLFLLMSFAFGQHKKIEKADELFNSYQYMDAIEAYLKIIKENQGNSAVYKHLADSYYNVFNVDEASKWYKKTIETKQDGETYYRYAQVLKSQGNYELANRQLDIFAKLMPNDPRAISHLENPNYIPKLADASKAFNVESTTINDAIQSDFGAILSNDNNLYFVSSRTSSIKKDNWTNQPYLDIYKSVRKEDGILSKPQGVSELNTDYHDGPLTISADGKTMYFSRDGHSEGTYKKLKKKRLKIAQQGLYKATLINGKWGNIKALPINSNEYTVTHPSLSKDGKTLYFASNMEGGVGDTDIWKISINGETYGKPVNLGPNVNSSGKEGFPFISDDDVLYFSSIGRMGIGGLDIFKFDLNTNEDAQNLGASINTNKDDFAFSINKNFNVGYFTSNRSGVDNIYMAIPICQFKTIAIIKDIASGQIVSDAVVTISDALNNKIATQKSDKKGETVFNVNCNDYTLHIQKSGYQSTTISVETSNGDDVTAIVKLKPINELITETEVKLNNIYFQFNKSNITEQGATELNKLVKIMQDYRDMKILVRSHTDSKGRAEYNLKLSEQRAQATVQYLISKGVSEERLSAKGMGSLEPKIDCKSNCTEEQDAENRRSEFLIVK